MKTTRGRTRQLALTLMGVAALAGGGCSSMSHTQEGMGVGALGGAGVGAAIGSATGQAGKGALIGGAVGAIGGALVGNEADKDEKKKAEVQQAQAQAAAQQAGRALGLTDVAQLAQQGVSDGVIIGQIRSTGSRYNLSSNDIVWLKQNGVSDAVVQEMQATASRGPQRVIVAQPPPPTTVIYERPYYGPPAMVGVGYYGRWR
jgi:hypothetical protein